MNSKSREIFRVKGSISYIRRLLSFIFISGALFLVVYNFVVPFTSSFDIQSYNPIAYLIVAAIPFIFGAAVGTRIDLIIDRENKKITLVKGVEGIIYSKKIMNINKVNGVSIFRNHYGFFESRLFYDEDKYLYLHEIRRHLKAYSKVKAISEILNIPLYNNVADESWRRTKSPYISSSDRQNTLRFSEGKRPFWQNLTAFIFYLISVISFYIFITLCYRIGIENVKNYTGLLELSIICFGTGLSFSLVKDYIFDIENKNYKIEYRVGPFYFGNWKTFKTLEYISLHLSKKGVYQVNLWYNKRRHFKIGDFLDYEPSEKQGSQMAFSLKLDFLNSAHPEGQQWILYKDQKILEN